MTALHLEHDWFSLPLPGNIHLGKRTWLYSSYAFTHYRSRAAVGLRVGSDTGLYHGTFFDLGPNATVDIGDFCSLVGVIFATNGRVSIGDYTFIAHEVVIAENDWAVPGGSNVTPDTPANAQRPQHAIDIGRNVWIGAQTAVVGNLRIGEGAIIGAGTVVTKDVPPFTLCVGNPMQIVRTVRST